MPLQFYQGGCAKLCCFGLVAGLVWPTTAASVCPFVLAAPWFGLVWPTSGGHWLLLVGLGCQIGFRAAHPPNCAAVIDGHRLQGAGCQGAAWFTSVLNNGSEIRVALIAGVLAGPIAAMP